MTRALELCRRLVETKYFEYGIIAVIVANSVILGLETVDSVNREYGDWMHLGNLAALIVFIVEAALKMIALAPRPDRYFRDGWNVFDFSIIVLALIPATGQFAMIARLARLLRALRLVSRIPELRLIISALVRSIPSAGHVMLLMSIIVYIYAVMGYHLFHEHDPANWGSPGHIPAYAVQHHHTGRLDRGDAHGDGVELLRLDLLRQLRDNGHLCGHQPVYSHHHQQPGRGKGRTSPRPAGSSLTRRTPP